ncbi:unnamed protein product [Oikopleura dioica]|uniref:Uncharacterized protein n=1 Tax=Oikopleura dioica TaxID=34765 RepID=E4XCH9_OIKDI|nr:unnamed protein product [Oikopleura dioica]
MHKREEESLFITETCYNLYNAGLLRNRQSDGGCGWTVRAEPLRQRAPSEEARILEDKVHNHYWINSF